jgi:maltose/moltooligosaccharide transporter
MNQKPQLSFWQIWNMSFGFLGIQFGFMLQITNMSRIFQTYGAEVENLAIYAIAGPVTGLLVQPIIGYLSDRTWSPKWGRRHPFFLIGAILATLALLVMPNSPGLYFSIGMLWVMDSAFNISMEPFRAFVGDMLPERQRTMGYAMQSFFIGLGSVISALLPTILTKAGVANVAEKHEIPDSVKFSFYIGAAVLLAAVLVTVFTTKEYPPADLKAFEAEKQKSKGILHAFTEIIGGLVSMPKTMLQLAVVQFFTWFGLNAMWAFMTPTVASNIFQTKDTESAAFQEAGNWVGVMFACYSLVAFMVAFLLPVLAKATSRKTTHLIALALGGVSLISILFIHDKYMLLLPMIGVGIAWASLLSMPYAILVGALPEGKLGYYVGVFNFFIVIPQLVASTTLGPILKHVFHGETIYMSVLGGISFLIAAVSVLIVQDKIVDNKLS